ncbi:MAG: polysaccharide deacetylase family protein [Bacilli bacterium]|nr:polysaccharide deacetylase family protein [Bacilli bacterium]
MSKKKIMIIGLITFVGICLVGLSIYFFWPAKFELKKGNLILNYGEKYKEPGFKVTRFGKNYTKKIKTKNNINHKKIGKYDVTYSVKINNITFKKNRVVKIADTEKPKIELKGGKTFDVCPETKFKEEGFKVTDNYDKNLDKKVKIKKEKDKIIYSVTDTSGNKTKIIRKLIYQDKTKPEITLNGGDNATLYVGTAYKEQGAKAIDNCDGDLTKEIKQTGSVDSNKVGKYTITYTVKDKAGNETTLTRTVNIINKSSLNDGKPRTIYLTFDDGPNSGTTNIILDILKEEGVKATFFVTCKGPDELIKREYDEGHTVALHTATHDYSIVYASDESYYNDLQTVQDRVKRITGQTSMIIRFPGGASNTVSRKYSPGIMTRLTQSTLAKGYKYYDWNISSGDAGGTNTASGVYNNVISQLRKQRANMVLMHDIKPYTRDALRQIIKYGKESGYTFEKITMDTPMITQRVNN